MRHILGVFCLMLFVFSSSSVFAFGQDQDFRCKSSQLYGVHHHWNGQEWVYREGPAAPCNTWQLVKDAAIATFKPREITTRPDKLGLEETHVAMEKRIGIVVGEAVGMNQVYSNYAWFFGPVAAHSIGTVAAHQPVIPLYHKYWFYDPYGELGNAIQREATFLFSNLRYKALAPRTGAQSQDVAIIQAERDGSVPTKETEAEFVVVLAYGILNEQLKQRQIDGSVAADIFEPWLPFSENKWERLFWNVVRSFGYADVDSKIEALLAISIYNPQRELLKHATGTVSFSWDEFKSWTVSGFGQTTSNNASNLVLAKKLVMAAAADFQRKRIGP